MTSRRIAGALSVLAALLLLAPPAFCLAWSLSLSTICFTDLDLQRLYALAAAGGVLLLAGLWALFGARRRSVS